MGLTLLAIFTAALLLPGIIAARAFYYSGQTREVEVPVPSLSTADGIAFVGGFSVAVHACYIVILTVALANLPTGTLPPANPYALFADQAGRDSLHVAWELFSGLLLLSVLSVVLGLVTGKLALLVFDKSVLYGPLADVIDSASGDDKFITAYVISKVQKDERLIGYQGTVDSLFRDADRFPTKLVLKDVVPFYFDIGDEGPDRVESDQLIDWLVLSADDWHNVAFKVFQWIDEVEAENAELPISSVEKPAKKASKRSSN